MLFELCKHTIAVINNKNYQKERKSAKTFEIVFFRSKIQFFLIIVSTHKDCFYFTSIIVYRVKIEYFDTFMNVQFHSLLVLRNDN